MGKPQNTVKCELFVPMGEGRRQGGQPLSRRGEKAYGSATASGAWAPNRILELTLIVGSAGLLDPHCHRRVGSKAIE